MIIKTYSNKGLDMEYTSADDIERIEVIDEESEEIIRDIHIWGK